MGHSPRSAKAPTPRRWSRNCPPLHAAVPRSAAASHRASALEPERRRPHHRGRAVCAARPSHRVGEHGLRAHERVYRRGGHRSDAAHPARAAYVPHRTRPARSRAFAVGILPRGGHQLPQGWTAVRRGVRGGARGGRTRLVHALGVDAARHDPADGGGSDHRPGRVRRCPGVWCAPRNGGICRCRWRLLGDTRRGDGRVACHACRRA